MSYKSKPDPLWPRRADGSQKTMAEMTRDQQDAIFLRAVDELAKEFKSFGVVLKKGK